MEVLTNPIIKATAATAAAATLLGVAVTPAFADQTATPSTDGQNQTSVTPRERLAQAIEAAQAKAGQEHTWDDTSKTAFDKALADAKAVTSDTTDEDVTAIASRLETATDALTSKARKALDDAIEAANTKAGQDRDWDETTKTAFDKALKAANAADADAADDTLETLAADLTDATGALTTVQRTGFESAVKSAQAMCLETKYTAEWCQQLTATVSQARASVAGAADDKAGDDTYAAATATITDFMASPEYATDQSLTDALASAKAFQARDLTYASDMEGAKSAFDKALKTAKASVHKDAATQKAAVADLNNAQSALLGASVQEKAYDKALKAAQALTGSDYTADSYGTLSALLTGFDPNTADAKTLEKRTKAINDAIDALEVASWSVDGTTLTEKDGVWTGRIVLSQAPSDMKAVGSDGRTVSLTAGKETFTQGSDTLGVGVTSGTLTGSGSKATFNVAYEYRDGSETSVKGDVADGTTFTLRDGAWTASYTGALGTKDDPAGYDADTVTLSDGSELKRTALSDVSTTPIRVDGKPDKTQLRRTVTFSGTDSHGTAVTLTGELAGTYDETVSLSLSYTTSDGDTVAVDVPGMPTTADELPASVTLPAQERSLAGMKWNVDVEKGGSVSDVSSSSTVTADGTRVFLVTIRYFRQEDGVYKAAVKRVRVTVPFRAAAKVVGNEKAALKGFTVNGQAMDGYSEDVVDYTIHAGADEKVLVSPVAQAGQDVRAGDSKQTAYTTTQYWTVSKDGETRTYSVTLVRDHDTPTADEAFEPNAPSGLVTKDANPSVDNTALKSVGYTLDGVYHPADGSDVTVPEGGTFAYESYEGQTVDVTSSKTGGMTWTYSIGVLAADDTTYAVHEVSVTYLTAATHKAELTGIKADGVAISGFDPKTLEYTVKVANADRYVITPVFDKTSGMGVTVHKDGHTVTLTATSADGLVRTVYTVHVESDSVLAGLAATGVGMTLLAPLAGLLALLGVGAAVAGRRREM